MREDTPSKTFHVLKLPMEGFFVEVNLYKTMWLLCCIYNPHKKYISDIRKNIFACLFSVHNTISLSRHEQVCLMRLRFERYFSHHRAM